MDLVLEKGFRAFVDALLAELPKDSGQDARSASSAYRIGHNDGMRLVAEKAQQYFADDDYLDETRTVLALRECIRAIEDLPSGTASESLTRARLRGLGVLSLREDRNDFVIVEGYEELEALPFTGDIEAL